MGLYRETKTVRCPGLPYPDYTELDKCLEEGWVITKVRCEPDDHSVYFALERYSDVVIPSFEKREVQKNE